jgi:phage tail-like protein
MTRLPPEPIRLETFLPEVFREGEAPSQASSEIHRLVRIIESIFAEFGEEIENIPDLFDPHAAPVDFLPWLASWMALILRADWDESQQRAVVAKIIPLYAKRGTKSGIEEYLKIYAGEGVTIKDELTPMQLGTSSTVGVDTVVGGQPPYFFIVNVAFAEPDPEKLKPKVKAVKDVLDIEKPAHTFYQLNFQGPTLQIGFASTVGEDTLI